MYLPRSATGLRCVADGFALSPPTRGEYHEAFERICGEHGLDSRHRLALRQTVRDGVAVDAADRVQAGAALLLDLAADL